MNDIGVVAIGRNEGERLRRCLSSLSPESVRVVYVDSGSTDGSCELARSFGVHVVELDTSIPFTAARARNAGLRCLLRQSSQPEYVQFVDGDCEMVSEWLVRSAAVLEADSTCAGVCGRRRERFPDRSIYNRMIDSEWDTLVGEVEACGGDSMMRVSALQQVGLFDDSVAAGEEPELCLRLRESGWKLRRVDLEMTIHDAAILRFSQWWRRHVRSGYGGSDVQRRFGVKSFDSELRSARIWTLGWLGFWVTLSVVGGLMFGPIGAVGGTAAAMGVWGLQCLRLARRCRRNGFPGALAVKAAAVTLLVKWANLIGQLQYAYDERRGRVARMINYKEIDTPTRDEGVVAAS